jgi:hypothetical protein
MANTEKAKPDNPRASRGYIQPAGLFVTLVGVRGSSKTTLAARLTHLVELRQGLLEPFVLLTSPTFSNNRETLLWAPHNTLSDDDVYTDPSEDRATVESTQAKVRSGAALLRPLRGTPSGRAKEGSRITSHLA